MGNWRNRPRSIEEVPESIPWIIGIDESGDSNLKNAFKKRNPFSGKKIQENDLHFNVTACLMKTKKIPEHEEKIMDLKYKYWHQGIANYKGIEKRVCFHSHEIRGRKNAFNFNCIEEHNAFIKDLSDVLKELNITLFSSHINKLELVKKYSNPFNPYELALTFLFERIAFTVKNEPTIIILESRGKKEDKELLKFIINLIDNGSQYMKCKHFNFIKGVYFNTKWKDNIKSYWILELADLYAFPISKFAKSGIKDKAFNILENKIQNYPEYDGKGLKIFPQ